MEPESPKHDSASPATTPQETKRTPEETKRYLEQTTELIITCWDGSFGEHGYDMMRQHFTPDFKLDYPDKEYPWNPTHTLEDHIDKVKQLKAANPAWKMNVHSVSATLDREQEHAIVWFTSGPSGDPGSTGEWSTNRESVCKLSWRREDGVWKAYAFYVIRGGAFIDNWG